MIRSLIDYCRAMRHRRAMFSAIDVARLRDDGGMDSRADGLRAIKRFELVNGVDFNPFDESHLMKVRGCASDERFFRIMKVGLNRLGSDD